MPLIIIIIIIGIHLLFTNKSYLFGCQPADCGNGIGRSINERLLWVTRHLSCDLAKIHMPKYHIPSTQRRLLPSLLVIRWRLGAAITALIVSTKLLYVGPNHNTGMGDHLSTDRPPVYVTSHPGQLSLLPSAGREMSSIQVKVRLEIKTGMTHSICGYTCGSIVNTLHTCTAPYT